MPVLFDIIKKNFKLLIRSKSSALIIILGPLLLIFLVGIAFDNINKYSLNIGTYSGAYSELSESFISKLQEQEFRVQKIDSEELCIQQIKEGKLHACIIFPPDLKIEPGKSNDIVFHVDYSKINLIWMVLDTLSTKLQERSSELSLDLTSNLLKKIEETKTEIYNKKPVAINLKTESQQAVEHIGTFRTGIVDIRDTSNEMRDYFLTKIQGAQAAVLETKKLVNDSNASTSQKNVINMKASEINTYLLNMYSKIENPSAETDWAKVARLSTEITLQVNSLNDLIASSSAKIDEIQQSLDNIYASLDSISIKEAATIVSPVTTQIKPVIPEKTHLNYLFPALIILVVMFISILLATTIVQMEKHSSAYFRNFITPTNSLIFVLGTFLTVLILVILQIVIILLISANFFEAQVIPSLGVVIPSLLIITTFFTLIGMFIGDLFTSEETATLAAISVGSVFLFLSNLILPLESMPSYVRNVAQYNPFVLSDSILRKAIVFQQQFSSIQAEISYLAAASLVLFLIILISYKVTRTHSVHRFFSRRKKSKKKVSK